MNDKTAWWTLKIFRTTLSTTRTITIAVCMGASAAALSAQVYQVNPDSSTTQVGGQKPATTKKAPIVRPGTLEPRQQQTPLAPKQAPAPRSQAAPPSRPQAFTPAPAAPPAAPVPAQAIPETPNQPELGFGSNINNARLARTAELALQRGDHAQAYQYASRAAQATPNDAQLWLLVGYTARLDGKLGPSADAYQRVLRLKPSSIDGMSGLAQTYMASGRTADAMRLERQVIAAAPDRKNDLLILGDLSVRSGDYQGAIEWLGRAERIEPTAQNELLLAIAYQHLKQMDQASHYLEMAKNRAPNNPDVERALAAFYRDTNDYPKAIEALLTIRNPRPDVVAELAFTYQLGGKSEEAARTYLRAANLLPNDLNLQLSAAQAQVSINDMAAAEPLLARAERINPNYYRTHAIRAQIAQIQDREEDAATEYAAAIQALPATPVEGPLYPVQLHMNLVPLYRNLNQPDQSKQQLAIAQQLISTMNEQGANRAAFLRLRAVIHSEAGEYEPALADLKEALTINPDDANGLQLDGDVLMKLGRTAEAVAVFQHVLQLDPHSRFALTSLGYAARATGDSAAAEKYFNQLAADYPTSYVPYLALGDMYTDNHQYDKAEQVYEKGYTLAKTNGNIVAGGMNAAIESHNIPLAGTWQGRVTDNMASVPQVLREEERYFSFTGDTQRSASLGRQAIKMIPRDREVVVYLGYDLLRLEQWDELKALTEQYMDLFPKEADIPLLAGYVDKHNGDLQDAVDHFTEALSRDPKVVTAYTNRGFVYNDLHKPDLAAKDFEASIKLQPNDAEAHMGLAFAELNLGHPRNAIEQTNAAQRLAGDSKLIHTVRATAYGRLGMLTKSANEYQAALKFDPNDGSLYLGLANIYMAQHRYNEALTTLDAADKHLPGDPNVYAVMARANAELGNREATMHDIELADANVNKLDDPEHTDEERMGLRPTVSDIYVSTGESLSVLHDEEGAMQRFTKALETVPNNRVAVRVAIARDMAQRGRTEDAERQIALAQMEVDAKDARPATGEQYLAMAGILQQLHEYELSESYLEKAKDAGAPDTAVRISLANSYLALGETRKAAAELAAVKQVDDSEVDYQYLLAQASLYQQEHRSAETLSTFAAAASDSGDDPTAEQQLLDASGSEGYRVTKNLSILSTLTVQPIFEDSTVYVLDSKLASPSGPVQPSNTAALPPPRSSIETSLTNTFKLHLGNAPTTSGFFQIRNAQGQISIPATGAVVQRNTTDYVFNAAINPTLHIGTDVITFNSGIQGTLRRDSNVPVELNQNLFRVFTYATTSSFMNAISADGYASYETGSFTGTPISEHIGSGAINFRVGAPWGKTALITGWKISSQHYDSTQLGNSQNYVTSSYIGLDRKFGPKFNMQAIAEDIRAWRSEPYSPIHSAISQSLRPAATIDYAPSKSLEIQASSSYQLANGFHTYDLSQNALTFSYVRSLSRTFNSATGKERLKYPIRISGGIREESFTNFGGGGSTKVLPFFTITIF